MKKLFRITIFFLFNLYCLFLFGDGIECKENRFWSVSQVTDSIEEFEISGNTIISHGVILYCPGPSLSFCNNLDNGNFSPTFYTHVTVLNPGVTHVPMYYNGTNWDTSNTVLTINPGGCGGFGNSVYFVSNPISIGRYNGLSVTYTPLNTNTIADVAVDTEENAWIVSCTTPNIADSILVMDTSGVIIKTYTLNTTFQLASPYGCFLLNGVLYIGQHNLNTITPITFAGNIGTVGTPLNMPPGNYSDLASCSPGSILAGISTIEESQFNVYPNPSNNIFRFSTKSEIKEISIKNILGDEIILSASNEINLETYPANIYFYSLTTKSGKTYKGKLVKQ